MEVNLCGFYFSSLDLLLERLCLEGTRRQAKYSVHALAAITKDDGLMSLSVLYKVSVTNLILLCYLFLVLQSILLAIEKIICCIFNLVEACGFVGREESTFTIYLAIFGVYSSDIHANF
jgi:hypothetical protein